ncbi:hypothetical protein [Desertibacillus haloalkaliphilus]|uniref:hypothetical protein n=1 Tax=Desertibacillus haloalkaliphilus TaxID=1328930 RepID=UPI001C25BDEA|nr:hypothetical protein [Desertibacillus haloalkaliphilus]MBU8908154.1 hypothetical protein [Desertibacillus haloalkaliphilus]
MDLKTFFEKVEQEQKYLAGGDYSFEELLRISRKNHRIRKVFVFYALSNREYFNKFSLLSSRTYFVRRLKDGLLKALMQVERNEMNRIEAIQLARLLKLKFFKNDTVVYHQSSNALAEDFEKFLTTLVNEYESGRNDSKERQTYRQNVLKAVDMNNLFANLK